MKKKKEPSELLVVPVDEAAKVLEIVEELASKSNKPAEMRASSRFFTCIFH